ncbi:hypothetical protein N9W89_00900 [Hellea sp.]|nr:hypothetical protein [Hellea sp.]
MDNPKLRKLVILFHLFAAGFMAPAFLLVAVTGGMHLVGGVESESRAPLVLPAGTQIDLKSPAVEDDIRALLKSANIDHKFEYIRDRGTTAQTRPTSRPYINFRQRDGVWTAEKVTPNFMKAAMEIHKGHGPKLLRAYHKLVALLLLGVVFGGLMVGLLAKAYRRKTLGALAVGTLLYLVLVFIA